MPSGTGTTGSSSWGGATMAPRQKKGKPAQASSNHAGSGAQGSYGDLLTPADAQRINQWHANARQAGEQAQVLTHGPNSLPPTRPGSALGPTSAVPSREASRPGTSYAGQNFSQAQYLTPEEASRLASIRQAAGPQHSSYGGYGTMNYQQTSQPGTRPSTSGSQHTGDRSCACGGYCCWGK
ncbi:uncharacterized protein JCM6883_001076 [Sporobolomyces salmoneus]|uniref:uncharacterized protein n=1 Tax=Sporobolomyces salmoneus TaxID=183962 RepID=UPI003181E822